MLDLPDFTDDFVHEQWCIHPPAYSAYVTNKTKKQNAVKCKYRHLFLYFSITGLVKQEPEKVFIGALHALK